MLRWLVRALVLLAIVVGLMIAFAGALFNKATTVEDWSPSSAPAERSLASSDPFPIPDCTEHNELKNAYFGDLHIHTRFSMDARSRDMRAGPDHAYAFARGQLGGLGPFDDDGEAQRPRQLLRPLDFAAVTDHAEWIGEVNLCTDPGSDFYDHQECQAFRRVPGVESSSVLARITGMNMLGLRGLFSRPAEICGENGVNCREALKSAWEETQSATEAATDYSSDCRFTGFHGWEFSDSTSLSKVHRNVIFRNNVVPEIPISSFETSGPYELWSTLDRLCLKDVNGCEAITIPHNSNVSNGRSFTLMYKSGTPSQQRRVASTRARYEPIVEMMQIKGESECRNNAWNVIGNDEQCGFEKLRHFTIDRPEDCEGDIGSGAIAGFGCQSRLDFARYAIIEGMAEKRRLGINPLQLGFIGSTDNHNGAPGDVSESDFEGCCADSDAELEQRLSEKRAFAGVGNVARNPGGLVGIWAEQNRRDNLFDAMQRREVFATSGPRIQPRFYAMWGAPDDVCQGDTVAKAVSLGVAMGGTLAPSTEHAAPSFVALASMDAGDAESSGTPLQRLQVIKVWPGENDQFHQQVIDIAGSANNGASVNLDSCEQNPGPAPQQQMCAQWTDPEFDPKQHAAYYLRVLENPSCRWSWHSCLSQAPEQRSAACHNPDIARTIQERAWTSPIWYEPPR